MMVFQFMLVVNRLFSACYNCAFIYSLYCESVNCRLRETESTPVCCVINNVEILFSSQFRLSSECKLCKFRATVVSACKCLLN